MQHICSDPSDLFAQTVVFEIRGADKKLSLSIFKPEIQEFGGSEYTCCLTKMACINVYFQFLGNQSL